MSAGKRSGSQDSTSSSGSGADQPPPAKKAMTQFEPVRLGSVSTLEEMDILVLKFQNKKLAERLEHRHRAECELRSRIDQLEKRQMQDDAVLCIVNRYWNQLNEDIRVMLQRFDAETADESESKNENEATTSFLVQLSTWDKQELEEKLAQRVQVSQRAVAKIIQAFDRLVQRNEKITLALKGDAGSDTEDVPSLDESVRSANSCLQNENRTLQALVTSLHEKHHVISLRIAGLQEQVTATETENAELKNRVEDLEYDLEKTRTREEKLDRHLSDALERLKGYEGTDADGKPSTAGGAVTGGGSGGGGHLSGISFRKVDDLQRELEEEKEMSNNRMLELERLHQGHKDALKEIEKLKMDIQQLPESVIVETTEYKCLQSQFSVLYNESMQMKTQLDESRGILQSSKNTHLRQIEQMESEELMGQKKIRTEVIQLEDLLAQMRKEYEMLRIEFEQNLAANEQTGPINREMRHLITSLQNHNQQLKGEILRFKRKLKESNLEVTKLKVEQSPYSGPPSSESSAKDASAAAASSSVPCVSAIKGEDSGSAVKRAAATLLDDDHPTDEERERDNSAIRELKTQLKKSQEAQKEMKLLLDMYKGVPKEQRDKVQLMAAEKRARFDAEELNKQLKKMHEGERRERRKLADEDAVRRIKQLEDIVAQLHKSVAAQKQEEEALLSEMEVTGQAFEDMQEQNIRLIQQLREKDDANFKLMSERIKSNQIHKLLREEKDILGDQVNTLQTQVDAQNQVVRKLEEKERILQNSLSTVEKELSLRQQAMEMHKRKAIESAQSAADLKLHLEKYHAQLKEAQGAVADKTCSLEQESFKIKRLQEEIAGLRKKIERAKKFELSSNADEVLMEEIREYKEQLTCPSCKVKRKDAVLTKCFHVFCFDCLKTRYETRQRKCPKCNAAFGANDFHRLYLS